MEKGRPYTKEELDFITNLNVQVELEIPDMDYADNIAVGLAMYENAFDMYSSVICDEIYDIEHIGSRNGDAKVKVTILRADNKWGGT